MGIFDSWETAVQTILSSFFSELGHSETLGEKRGLYQAQEVNKTWKAQEHHKTYKTHEIQKVMTFMATPEVTEAVGN